MALRILVLIFGLLPQTVLAQAQAVPARPDRVGDVHELRLVITTENKGTGSSGSSSSRTALIERVIALRDDGLELEFDLPRNVSAEERAKEWKFPARVFKSPGQPVQLLNAPELKVRLGAWLELGGYTVEQCGQWFFTWTAFKIECDPQSVLKGLVAFDLRPADLREGALHTEHGALGTAPWQMDSIAAGGASYTAQMPVDPDAVRRERAATDIVVASITGQPPITLETALQRRASDRISGTITTTYETDAAGSVTRLTRVVRLEIIEPGGVSQSETVTTIERALVSP